MIRLITGGRLAALREDLDRARDEVREVRERAERHIAEQARTVERLAAGRVAAEQAAGAAIGEANEVRQRVAAAQSLLKDAAAVNAAQADRIESLEVEADRLAADRSRWMYRYYEESRTYWDAELPPGGECCADCRQPVESEPCPDHHPRTVVQRLRDRVTELEQQAAEAAKARRPAHLSLLRHYGELHSLHATHEDAYGHAEGIAPVGTEIRWGPADDRPVSEVEWSVNSVPLAGPVGGENT
ncbi:hypothetical protein ACFU99_32370 [Streptomyces sp. NPDC057654]|uniref:hypothetical protein n=1 Tax=Streptomyces sp. NPDC057654 TaxID=3346196 RepID=UPI0036C173C0